MTITVGQRYHHIPTNIDATVTSVGSHQRVMLRLDDGRELHDVPVHQLRDLAPVEVHTAPPVAGAQFTAPHAVPRPVGKYEDDEGQEDARLP